MPDPKTATFYRITGLPAPAPHAGAVRALSDFLDRIADRLAGGRRRGAAPKRRRP
jgi:hypothetical protein